MTEVSALYAAITVATLFGLLALGVWVGLALMGTALVGMLIERPQDVEPALREARALKDRTVFMDFRTDPTENVFPMVQAGKGITEMLLGSEDL